MPRLVSDKFIREYEAVVRTVRNIRGPGVRNIFGQGITITFPEKRWERPQLPSDRHTRIRVDSNRTGRAWYKAYVWNRPTTGTVNTATDADEATAGVQGVEVSALNWQELVDGSGHDLTLAGNTGQRLFSDAWFTGQVDEEDRPVVHFNGIYVGCI